jgi:hypothetical protein
MLTGLTAADLPKDLLELPPGTCYLMSTNGEMRRVSIPKCTSDDLVHVAGLLSDHAPTMPKVKMPGSRSGQCLDSSDTAPARGEVWTAQDAHILQQLRSGKTPQEITRELSGSKSGRAYNDMLSVVNAVIYRVASGEQSRAVGQ